jgi:hypothetical protein
MDRRLLFVYIFGLVEGRSKGYKKRKAEEEQEKKSQPPLQPETVTVDDPGILRIKNENGAFALDLDGNRVSPISLLPEQRKRLIEILNIIRPWLEDALHSNIHGAQPPLSSLNRRRHSRNPGLYFSTYHLLNLDAPQPGEKPAVN